MAPKDHTPENRDFSPLWDSPSYRQAAVSGPDVWLRGKRADDDAKDLWRIHDNLYDLTDYIIRHPGGPEWLRLTKGTDITEAFEAHHLSERPRRMLDGFLVKKASTPRNSIYTFAKDGFYNTLRDRVREEFKVTDSASKLGPPWRTCLAADFLFLSTLVFGCLAVITGYKGFIFISGILLCFLTISAHNFFHQRDSMRMLYFDLSLLASRDWRISHALSHHLFPNSMLDLEITMFEPFIQYLPSPKKGLIVRYISWLYCPILWTLIFHLERIKRIVACKMVWRDAIPLILPAVLWAVSGFKLESVGTVLTTWFQIIFVASFLFGYIGLNAGHHHPEVFHAGDTPRVDHDWGLAQIDAVIDRVEVCGGVPEVSLVTFGNHALHHLFPTIDNAHLPRIYPIFFKTCNDFGIDFSYGTFWITTKGQFQQLARNQPNPNPPQSLIQKNVKRKMSS